MTVPFHSPVRFGHQADPASTASTNNPSSGSRGLRQLSIWLEPETMVKEAAPQSEPPEYQDIVSFSPPTVIKEHPWLYQGAINSWGHYWTFGEILSQLAQNAHLSDGQPGPENYPPRTNFYYTSRYYYELDHNLGFPNAMTQEYIINTLVQQDCMTETESPDHGTTFTLTQKGKKLARQYRLFPRNPREFLDRTFVNHHGTLMTGKELLYFLYKKSKGYSDPAKFGNYVIKDPEEGEMVYTNGIAYTLDKHLGFRNGALQANILDQLTQQKWICFENDPELGIKVPQWTAEGIAQAKAGKPPLKRRIRARFWP